MFDTRGARGNPGLSANRSKLRSQFQPRRGALPAVAEPVPEEVIEFGDSIDLRDRFLDVVEHPAELDRLRRLVEDDVGGPGIAVAGLLDGSDVDEDFPVPQLQLAPDLVRRGERVFLLEDARIRGVPGSSSSRRGRRSAPSSAGCRCLPGRRIRSAGCGPIRGQRGSWPRRIRGRSPRNSHRLSFLAVSSDSSCLRVQKIARSACRLKPSGSKRAALSWFLRIVTAGLHDDALARFGP